ncbi:hypothetical protein NE237_015177 [Protea cynaroides]|uniref:Uncharacterized protein n=1 Tax=Protea cynaroides TaxID=273540 RepID=A0A9Q0KDS9_9MAGN|nr:hypothetical protein NE237_015177 [Protea cynaroides]
MQVLVDGSKRIQVLVDGCKLLVDDGRKRENRAGCSLRLVRMLERREVQFAAGLVDGGKRMQVLVDGGKRMQVLVDDAKQVLVDGRWSIDVGKNIDGSCRGGNRRSMMGGGNV